LSEAESCLSEAKTDEPRPNTLSIFECVARRKYLVMGGDSEGGADT